MNIKIAKETNDINTCYKLREIIFIKGQNVSEERERDNLDKIAVHFLLSDDENKPIGVARVVKSQKFASVERVGILEEYRKNGAGFFLMQNIINYCEQQNFTKIFLGAQEHALKFYGKLGFKIISEKYMDANIPHFKMQLELSSANQTS